MDELKKEKIALFRFQVIAPLLGLAKDEGGKKEQFLQDIAETQWDIPCTGRSAIGRSTVLAWLSAYEESGGNLRSLYPKQRSDRGTARCMDGETEQMLIALRKELGGTSVPTLLHVAQPLARLYGRARLPHWRSAGPRHAALPVSRTIDTWSERWR